MLETFKESWNYAMHLFTLVFKSMMFSREVKDPSFRLTYFYAKGLAECIRRALKYGCFEYTDERLTKDEFASRKEDFPYQQVPVLTVDDDKVLAESKTILRYVSKLGKTYPTRNHLNAAIVDQWCDLHTDCMTPITLNMYSAKFGLPSIDTVSHRKWCVSTHIPKYLDILEKELSNENGWLGGMNQISMADLCWYSTLEMWYNGVFDGVDAETFAPYPLLKVYMKDVATQLDETIDIEVEEDDSEFETNKHA